MADHRGTRVTLSLAVTLGIIHTMTVWRRAGVAHASKRSARRSTSRGTCRLRSSLQLLVVWEAMSAREKKETALDSKALQLTSTTCRFLAGCRGLTGANATTCRVPRARVRLD